MTPRRLFVHSPDVTLFGPGLEPAALRGLSQRALVLARPNDGAVVEFAPDGAFLDYLAALGFGPGQVFVPRDGPGGLVDRLLDDTDLISDLASSEWTLEPYFSGAEERRLAERLGVGLHGSETDIAERVNHKARLVGLLEEAGLPGVQTMLVPRDEVVATTRALLVEGPAIVRADVGIGGTGVWALHSPDDLESLPGRMPQYVPSDLFLVQRLLTTRSSPNVQFDLVDGRVEVVGATEQRLRDGIHHTGNTYPLKDACREEVFRQGCALAALLSGQGYRGYLGIDFVITTDDAVFAIEINPRLNSSSFGLLALGDHLSLDASSARDRPTSLLSLSGVPTPGIEGFAALHSTLGEDEWVGPDRATGVFPILPPAPGRPRTDLVVVGEDQAEVEKHAAAVFDRLSTSRSRACLRHEP